MKLYSLAYLLLSLTTHVHASASASQAQAASAAAAAQPKPQYEAPLNYSDTSTDDLDDSDDDMMDMLDFKLMGDNDYITFKKARERLHNTLKRVPTFIDTKGTNGATTVLMLAMALNNTQEQNNRIFSFSSDKLDINATYKGGATAAHCALSNRHRSSVSALKELHSRGVSFENIQQKVTGLMNDTQKELAQLKQKKNNQREIRREEKYLILLQEKAKLIQGAIQTKKAEASKAQARQEDK